MSKVLSEKLKQAKAFCAKHAEDESERYSLTFFAVSNILFLRLAASVIQLGCVPQLKAVRAEGDSALKQWCEWAV